MTNEIRLKAAAGAANVKALIVSRTATVWNGSAMVALNSLTDANWTASLIACTEHQTSEAADTGLFTANWPGALTQLAPYDVVFFSGASPSPGDDHIGVQSDPTEYQIERVADVYHADIELTVDGEVPQDQDEYTILWYKNGVWVASGVTNPKIQVIKQNGADLITLTGMNEAGSTHIFTYSEASNIITYGDAVTVVATATIDGSTRTWPKTLFRDNNT